MSLLASVAKTLIVNFIHQKWPGAKIEFAIKHGRNKYVVSEWKVCKVDTEQKHLIIGIDITDAPIDLK